MVKRKGKKSFKKYALPVLVTLVLFAVLVLAAIGDNIKVRSPTSGNNYSANNYTGNTHDLFNVSFLLGNGSNGDINTSNIQILNATFYINISATDWIIIGNSTNCVLYNGADSNVSCWGVLNATGNSTTLHSDGFYSVNATIFNTTGGADILLHGAKSGNLTTIIIDNNGPLNVNRSGLNDYTNHSVKSLGGNLTLNVSIADTTSSINLVTFNIINNTGQVNDTITGIREGTTSYWSISINTSHYPQGKVNVSVFVNDTVGNFNDTVNSSSTPRFSNLIFDNTKPSVSFSCTPSSVNTGDTVTCSCSGSATSGINSTSFTTNPSTTNTGTFTETCTVNSHSGLSASATASYTVKQSAGGSSSSSSSSSSGAGSGGGGVTAVSSISKDHVFSRIITTEPAVATGYEEDYGIDEITINVIKEATDVTLSVTKYDSKPTGVSTDLEGKVYKYLKIEASNLENKLGTAKIKAQVLKTWVEGEGLEKEDLVISKFNDGKWTELDTSVVDEDNTNYYYEAGVSSFSFFAIAEKEASVLERTGGEATTSGEESTSGGIGSGVVVGIIVAVALILLIVWFVRRKR